MFAAKRSSSGLRSVFLAILCIGAASNLAHAQAKPTSELIKLAQDTYERQDWIYAALHINGLIQRNPPELRSNPALVEQLTKGLEHAIRRLEEYRRLANDQRQSLNAQKDNDGGASVSSNVTGRPPKIDWPR